MEWRRERVEERRERVVQGIEEKKGRYGHKRDVVMRSI